MAAQTILPQQSELVWQLSPGGTQQRWAPAVSWQSRVSQHSLAELQDSSIAVQALLLRQRPFSQNSEPQHSSSAAQDAPASPHWQRPKEQDMSPQHSLDEAQLLPLPRQQVWEEDEQDR